MPATINGIGTNYIGKRHIEKHVGVCEKCGQTVTLTSYETRTWFVILFIPIIPLGRKMVLDYCPKCTAHRVVPLVEWQRIKDEAVADALRKTKEHPDDAAAAMELFGTLVAFHHRAEATEMAQVLEMRFGDNTEVLMELAHYHDLTGDGAKADALILKALEHDPENHDVRVAAAVTFLERGELKRARELLSFMETGGGETNAKLLMMLATRLQQQGNHREALEVFGVLARDGGDITRSRDFRKAVKQSQDAVGPDAGGPVVPRPPRRLGRKLGLAGVVLVALAVGHYFLTNQTLHVVNALSGPALIALDGDDAQTFPTWERTEVTLRPGVHEAVITTEDRFEETVTLDMRLGFWDRMLNKPVFVLNPGGAATIAEIGTIYSEKPDPNETPELTFHFGKSFETIRNTDYGFDEFPESIELSRSGQRVRKTRLQPIFTDAAGILLILGREKGKGEQMRYAESQVNLNARNEGMISSYFALCDNERLKRRAAAFLARDLDERPVQVVKHRAYQAVRLMLGEEDDLIAMYDDLLAKDPANASLMYLCARLEVDTDEAEKTLDRAVSADASNPWPYFAKGITRYSRAAFDEARPLFEKAYQLDPDQPMFEQKWFLARLACGETASLETTCRENLTESPLDLMWHCRLMMVLSARGELDEVRKAADAYARAIREEAGTTELIPVFISRLWLAYHEGNANAALAECQKLSEFMDVTELRFLLAHESDDPGLARQLHGELPDWGASRRAMLLACACIARGESSRAAEWHRKAVAVLRAQWRECRMIADLLEKGDGVTVAEVNRITLDAQSKVALLVLLAHRSPKTRDELLALARKLNVDPTVPYHLFQRAIARLR